MHALFAVLIDFCALCLREACDSLATGDRHRELISSLTGLAIIVAIAIAPHYFF